jgi:hypothetical protein
MVRLGLGVAVLAGGAYALTRPGAGEPAATGGLGVLDVLLSVAALGGTIAVVAGWPEPRLATRWAWFWLIAYCWPAALVFLLLEPTPAWRRGPVRAPRRRLTGGWGFLLALLLGTPLIALLTGALTGG